MTRRRFHYPFVLLLAFAIVAAACGDGDEPAATTAAPATTAAATTAAATATTAEVTTAEPTDDTEAPATTAAATTTTPPTTQPPQIDEGDVMRAPDRVQDAETVVIAWTGFYNSLDPPDSLVNFNREAGVGLYDRLLTYSLTERDDGTFVWEGLDVAPGLAESWEIDGGSVTFTIRQGVTFNKTGNPLTAHDIRYSFVRAIEVPGFGTFNSNLAGIFEPSRQITVIDDYTIRFDYELADGTPFLLKASLPSMRFPIFGIVDSVELQARATDEDPWGHEWLKENPEGSGPYVIESVTPGTELILRRVPGHWTEGDQNQLNQAYNGFDRVIYRTLNSPADITALMLGGEVDVAFALGTRELVALGEAGFTIVNAEIPDIWRLDLPVTTPPFDNLAVRQALAYAVPYDTIVENVFTNATRSYSIVNPASPSFIPAWDIYDTDLDKARQLLADAGYPDGFSTELFYNTERQEWEDIALFLQASLSQVGIDLTLRPLPATEFQEQTTARYSDDTLMPGIQMRSGLIWLDDADPNVNLWLVTRGFPGPVGVGGFSNASHYSNVELDTLHFENRFNPDFEARAEAYRETQRIGARDLPLIPLAVRGFPGAVHPAVTGVAFTADPHLRQYLLRPTG
ncbi:MAG: ABC transporter substrate-binding protein [bacterium]|nr:ABC transporter substrate-binding protein [bacterium]MDE0289931.1 ABC transporter substrate-binding protein [bacterium]MDE0439742.1 ABC transporter substrate-binding protein [bacterium]